MKGSTPPVSVAFCHCFFLRFSDLIIVLISFCTIRKCCCISVSVTSGSTLYEATNSFNILHLRRVCASSCPMNSSLNKFILSPVLLNKNHQKIRWLEDKNYNTEYSGFIQYIHRPPTKVIYQMYYKIYEYKFKLTFQAVLSPLLLLNKNHQKIRWLEDQNYNTV